ncbi:Ovate transcriptional repressor [Rhynchospora pubera]|uniref:Transcription repressor n=1 Tax=Rhynchospora pubera TaxID=906938 RepID=A0AAV8DJD2_9POAL|nr:Ovate transcriptional repressor [Rhynchospora pubera]
MGKGLTSLLSCKYPKTTSFRAGTGGGTATDSDTIYKTMNTMYLDSAYFEEEIEIEIDTEAEPETTSSIDEPEEPVVVHQIHSDRLFFEPNSTSCSILESTHKGEDVKEEKTEKSNVPFKESFVLAMESTDPYNDFRISMEEMVAAHGLTDWTRLEELLVWYLRVNGKKNHAFIIKAFVDLLVDLVPAGITSEESSSSSCLTFDEVEGSSES